MKKTALVLICFLFAVTAAFGDAEPAGAIVLEARTFQFKHKEAEKAATVIKPLMSSEGSLSIQPSTNTLIVTDRAAEMRAIVIALEKFDEPAKSFKVSLKLVAASRSERAGSVPQDLKEISAKLSGILRFNSFEKLGEITTDGKEGDPVIIDVGSVYRADFKFGEYDPISDSIRLTDFRLGRLQPGAGDTTQVVSLLKTSLNLRVGQTVVLGASREPNSKRALMLVMVARRVY